MTSLTFDDEFSYGNRHAITLPVRLENLPYLIEALLDTGAAVSLFDSALLPDLGISDITAGQRVELRAANNEKGIGYVHSLQIEILGRRLMIPVAFSEDWPQGTRNLLGMRGFFEQVLVAFEHRERKFHYSFY